MSHNAHEVLQMMKEAEYVTPANLRYWTACCGCDVDASNASKFIAQLERLKGAEPEYVALIDKAIAYYELLATKQ